MDKYLSIRLGEKIMPGQLYVPPQYSDRVEALIPTPFPFGHNHASNLAQLDNGDLLCVWFSGSSEGASDIQILMSRLPAGADCWSEAEVVSNDPERSEQNPFVHDFGGGRLWVVHTAQRSRGGTRQEWDARRDRGEVHGDFTMQETAEIRVMESLDYGRTFHRRAPLNQKAGAFCRQPFLRISSGELLMGIWYSSQKDLDAESGVLYGNDVSACMVSADNGETWTEYPVPDSVGRVHMQPVELEPGRLIALYRSRYADRIHRSESSDGGRTWTAPVPTDLPNNNSSIQAKKLKSGNIALIYNHTPYLYNDTQRARWPDSRHPMSLALSEDGGKTWPYIRHVEMGDGCVGENNKGKNREYSYPSVIQTDDGKLHLSFTWAARSAIKHVIVDEKWIKCEGK